MMNVLPDKFFEKFKDKDISEDAVTKICSQTYDHVKTAQLAGVDSPLCQDAIMLIVVCQMLWNKSQKING